MAGWIAICYNKTRIPPQVVEKSDWEKSPCPADSPDLGNCFSPTSWEKVLIQSFFSVATCGDGNQESKGGSNLILPLLIVGFEGYGQKCPIPVIGRKSALSPNLDRVNLLIFERKAEKPKGGRNLVLLQDQIWPPRNNLAVQFWAVKLLVYWAQSNGEQIVHRFE